MLLLAPVQLMAAPLLTGLMLAVPPAAAPGPPPSAPAGSPSGHDPGALWPLDPRPPVVSGFSPPAEPWGAGHRGVDLLGHPGQPVHAARAGTVSYAGTIAGVGVVVVRNRATRETYEPVTPAVRTGQQVGAGQVLGTLATFGSHCFPRTCLHWALLSGERYLDPLSLLGAAPVRLLPLS